MDYNKIDFENVPCKITFHKKRDIELETTLVRTVRTEKEAYSLLKAIYIKDSFVRFEDLRTEIKLEQNGRTFLIRNAILKKHKDGDTLCYRVENTPVLLNERKEFRIPCSKSVQIQPDQHKAVIDTCLHDISFSGLSFLVKPEDIEGFQTGNETTVIVDRHSGILRIPCKVVRVQKRENDRFVVGCEVLSDSKAYTGFVANVQRQALKVKSE